MIPKIIHYCWFGNNPLPPIAEKCLKSWQKYCPDYELKLWNEKTFDIRCNDYVKEAYEAKKFAFVTDYVRLWAIYHYGGIYMDTDVEVLKPLDRFLVHPAFSGFEGPQRIPTGIMASEKHGKWAGQELEYYQNRHFLKEDGTLDLTTNVTIITDNLVNDGFVLNNCCSSFCRIISKKIQTRKCCNISYCSFSKFVFILRYSHTGSKCCCRNYSCLIHRRKFAFKL